MKILVIGREKKLTEVTPRTNAVHFSYRPNMDDILDLLEKCMKIKVISIPPSYNKTLAKGIRKLAKLMNIEIKVSTEAWGTRTDINSEIEIDDTTGELINDKGKPTEGK
jgi:hypothetical protein